MFFQEKKFEYSSVIGRISIRWIIIKFELFVILLMCLEILQIQEDLKITN